MSRRLLSLATVVAVSLVSACATLPTDPEERAEAEAINDPLEPTNRTIYDVNMFLDENVAEPVAQAYHDNAPEWLRRALHNLLANLQEPYTAGNDLLQGNPHAAADALGRFMINTTFGLGGTQDVVTETGGPKQHKTDLGITFAVWGVDEGPYLMLPFLGPSNLRDGAGRVADYFADPMGPVFSAAGAAMIGNVTMGVDVLDTRTEHLDTLKEIRRTSIDEYAAIRSLYRQYRDANIRNALNGQKDSHTPRPDASASGGSTAPVPASTSPSPAAAEQAPGQGAASTKDTEAKPSAVEFISPKK